MAQDPEQWTCPKCGEVMHPRKCRAHSKRDGRHCGDWAAQGSEVCRRHGGAAPQVRAAAARRVEEEGARRIAATYGLPREIDPHQALLEELHRTAGHVHWLGELIAELEHQETGLARVGVDGDVEGAEDLRQSSGHSGLKQYYRDKGLLWEKPSVWVELYQSERQQLAKVAGDCLKAGIEERLVKLAENQARMLAEAMQSFARSMGLDPADEGVRVAMRASLTAVSRAEVTS